MVKWLLSAAIVFLFFWISPSNVLAYYNNMPASVVVGQSNFTDDTTGVTDTNFANSVIRGLFVDSRGRLIASDFGNNRVLIWNQIPTTSGKAADLVLGQPDFTSNTENNGGRSAQTLRGPFGVYSDGDRLFVNDRGNARVLIWTTFPTVNQQAANVVVGQSDMTSIITGCDASHFVTTDPSGNVWVHNNKLLVATGNGQRRVLIWNTVPTSNGASADVVVGQPDMTTCASAATPTQASLNSARGMMVDPVGRLVVADFTSANRVMIWNSLPTTNNTPADVVVGQPDFTSSSAQTTTNGLGGAFSAFSDGNRLFVADSSNHRILIYNSVPTSNGASADLVLGQASFTSAVSEYGGRSASSMNSPQMVFEYQNKLFVSEAGGDRILIFDNVLSGPQLSMNTPESITDGKLKVTGSIQLGERGKYSLQRMQANVNGQGFGNVSYLSGGRDLSTDQTGYDYYHEFEPWAGLSAKDQYNISTGYTLNLKASSFNAEEDNIFYFHPFQLTSVAGSTLKIKLNKDHWDRIKSNLDSFEIQVKKAGVWATLAEKIPLDSEFVTSTKSLSGEIRLVAKDKWGHRQSATNSLKISGVGSYNPNTKQVTYGFPLQINSITGTRIGIVSTYMSMATNKFFINANKPTFSGIAYAGSTVTVLVTDPVRGNSQVFTTITKPNSSWSVTPSITRSSIIDVWVTDNSNRYTELPSFQLIPL